MVSVHQSLILKLWVIVSNISNIDVLVVLLNLTRRKDVLEWFPPVLARAEFSHLSQCCNMYYIYKALRSCEGMSSIIVVSHLFSIMRDQVEQLKWSGFSAVTIGIGEEWDVEKVINGECEMFSWALRSGFPNHGWRNWKEKIGPSWANRRLQWLVMFTLWQNGTFDYSYS